MEIEEIDHGMERKGKGKGKKRKEKEMKRKGKGNEKEIQRAKMEKKLLVNRNEIPYTVTEYEKWFYIDKKWMEKWKNEKTTRDSLV